MNSIKSLSFAIAATLASSTYALAQDDLMTIYQKALEQDPTLAIQRLNEENSQNNVSSAWSRLMPTVNASASYGNGASNGNNKIDGEDFDYDFENAGEIGYSLSVNQVIFNKGAIDGYSAVKKSAQSAVLNTSTAEQGLIVRVAEAYINVLKASDNLAQTEAQLKAVERQLEQTEQRFNVGMVAITDVHTARASFDSTKVGLILAQTQYDISRQNLSLMTGEVPESIKTLTNEITVAMPNDSSLDEWINFALSNHPSIRAKSLDVESAKKALAGTKAQRLPSVGGSFSYSYTDQINENASSVGSSRIGLQVSLPIYTGGQQTADEASRKITVNQAEIQLELEKRSVTVRVKQNYRKLQSDIQNIAAQKQAVLSSETALKATQVGYDEGTRNIVEVLNAESQLFASQTSYANARYDFLLDQLRLQQAAGALQASDLKAINDYMM